MQPVANSEQRNDRSSCRKSERDKRRRTRSSVCKNADYTEIKKGQPEIVLECCAHLAEKLTDQPVSFVDVYSEESVQRKT